MSIINEALKKASKTSEKNEAWVKTVLESFQTKPQTDKENDKERMALASSHSKMKKSLGRKGSVFVFLGLLFICGSIGGYYFRDKITLAVSQIFNVFQKESQMAVQSPSVSDKILPVLTDQNTQLQEAPSFMISEVKEQNFKKNQTTSKISKKIPSIELTGIMMENPPQALINGRFLTAGEKFKGIQIVRIFPDHVTFLYQGKKFKKWLMDKE
jgi:hypothetical protein